MDDSKEIMKILKGYDNGTPKKKLAFEGCCSDMKDIEIPSRKDFENRIKKEKKNIDIVKKNTKEINIILKDVQGLLKIGDSYAESILSQNSIFKSIDINTKKIVLKLDDSEISFNIKQSFEKNLKNMEEKVKFFESKLLNLK